MEDDVSEELRFHLEKETERTSDQAWCPKKLSTARCAALAEWSLGVAAILLLAAPLGATYLSIATTVRSQAPFRGDIFIRWRKRLSARCHAAPDGAWGSGKVGFYIDVDHRAGRKRFR